MSGVPTTAWTVVSRARSGRDGEAREDALDLTQGYFAVLIEKDYLADVRVREGSFRAFLLTSFRHFVFCAGCAIVRVAEADVAPVEAGQPLGLQLIATDRPAGAARDLDAHDGVAGVDAVRRLAR